MVKVPMSLVALRLAEEMACGGYLTARKAMMAAASRGLSLLVLSEQHPQRADYRQQAAIARRLFGDAERRTQAAYERWQGAVRRSDSLWTDTEGRKPQAQAVAR